MSTALSVAALRALAPAAEAPTAAARRAPRALVDRTAPAVAPAGEIRALNSVRGVAALMVAAYHAPMIFGVAHQLPHAYLAVDLFFVLSGFVMAHVYGGRIAAGMSPARFGQLRLARLYPLLALATLAGFAFWLLQAMAGKTPFSLQALSALCLNLAMAPANSAGWSIDGAAYPFCGQSWSILWEVALCALYYAWARWIGRGAVAIAAAAAVVLAVMAVMRGGLDGGWTYATFWVGGVRALFAFSAGVLVRRLVGGRIGAGAPLALWAPATVAAVAVVAYVALEPRTVSLLDLAAAVIAFPLIIAACALSRSPLVENRVGDRLGEASYSVYMLHGLAVVVSASILKHLPPLPQAIHLVIGLVWLAGLVGGCWLSWRYVETPLRRLWSRPLPRPGLSLRLRLSGATAG